MKNEDDLKQLIFEKYHELVKAANATSEEKVILRKMLDPSLDLQQEFATCYSLDPKQHHIHSYQSQTEFDKYLEDKGLLPSKWIPLLSLLDIESPADLKQLRLEQYNKLIKAGKATGDEKAIFHEILGPSLELRQKLEEIGFENASYWLPLLHKHGVYSCQSLAQLDPAKYHDLEPLAIHVGEKQALNKLFWSEEQQAEPPATCIAVNEQHETGFSVKLKVDSDSEDEVVTHPPSVGKIKSPISKEKLSKTIEVQDQSLANFDDLLRSLGLEEYYPQKLKENESSVVRKVSKIPLKKPKKIPFVVLQKLMMVNTECRSSLFEPPNRKSKEQELHDGTVHPMDALLALILCSDHFLRQIVFSKLAVCQLAVPFLLPDAKKGTVTLLLWAMRSIVKEYYFSGETREERIIECKAPIVSFMRYGELPNISKSELINTIMFNYNNNTFFHWNLVKGEPLRVAADGLVDMGWYLPSKNQMKNLFPCVVTIANLHGDCSVHTKQLHFLAKCSFTNVVLVNSLDVLSDDDIGMLRALSKVPGGLVLLSCEQSEETSKLLKGVAYSEISLLDSGYKKSFQTVKDEFKNILQKQSLTKHIHSITECVALAKEIDIVIDEETEECKCGRELALDHIDRVKSETHNKDELFPLQGKELWHKWAKENKALHRIPSYIHSEIEKYKQEKIRAKKEIRLQQWKQMSSVPLLVSKFYSNIIYLENGEEATSYYLYWIKLFLDDHSREVRKKLYPKYTQEKMKLPNSEKKFKEIVDRMIAASIGLYHFMREFGQMYETAQEMKKSYPPADTLVVQLPMIAARLLLSGHSFEIMDGDASHVPITWVSAVLEEVTRQLHNPNVLVVSVLGVQSTGTSTLLNTVFGLQFPVSAGRCTRGVFMQLVSLDRKLSKKMNYSHILVIDTEGLRAPELSSELSNIHDNEIATFVIGIADVTIINQFGEVFAEMENILQIVVHALLRMKEVKKKSKVVFVHQNVPGLLAREKGDHGRLSFKQMLDEMTLLAAKEERCESKYKSFNDVIKFRDDEDVFNFPSLWKGDPPMAPVNPGYSDKALKLKSHVLKTPSHYSMCSFIKHLNGVWGSILYEDFVFSFKNTLEVAAYSSLEKALSQWQWKLQKEMLAWERKTKYLFETCDFAEKAQKDLKQNQLLIVKKLNKQWDSEINHEKIKFFGGEYKETLVQWKAKTD